MPSTFEGALETCPVFLYILKAKAISSHFPPAGSDAHGFVNHFPKAGKEVIAVARACRGFRMVLQAHDRQPFVPQPLQCMIIEIDVSSLNIGRFVQHHMKTVILGGNFNASGGQILDRMVAAVMSELELFSRSAEGVSDKLMPEADACDRKSVNQLPHQCDFSSQRGRVAGPLERKIPCAPLALAACTLKFGGTARGFEAASHKRRRIFHLMPKS